MRRLYIVWYRYRGTVGSVLTGSALVLALGTDEATRLVRSRVGRTFEMIGSQEYEHPFVVLEHHLPFSLPSAPRWD